MAVTFADLVSLTTEVNKVQNSKTIICSYLKVF